MDDRKKSLLIKNLHKKTVPKKCFNLAAQLYSFSNNYERQKVLYRILKILCVHFSVPICRIKVHDKKRPKLRINGGIYLFGLYSDDAGEKPLIEIWNKTENKKIVSPRTILEVFIHEFIHHYDNRCLNLDVDHDLGFECRRKFLKKIFMDNIGERIERQRRKFKKSRKKY